MFSIVIEKLKNGRVRINLYFRGFILRVYVVHWTALIDFTLVDENTFTCRMARRVAAQPVTFKKKILEDGIEVWTTKYLGKNQIFDVMLHVHKPLQQFEQAPIADRIPDFLR